MNKTNEPVAKVVSSGPADFPILQWISAELSLSTKTGDLLYLHPARQISDAELADLWAKLCAPFGTGYFPIYSFARAIEAHIKGATE